MTTCIIVDDERNAREFLEKLINKHFPKKLIVLDTASSVNQAVNLIKKHHPELVFLDIQMPEEDGFELFKYFNNIFFDIIFTTAHKEYAIEAIRHAALDYLLKPINMIDLNDTIKRLERKGAVATNQQRITALLENMNNESGILNKIAVPTTNGYDLIKISGIMYCEGMDNYNKLVTFSGKEVLVTKTLKKMEELLPTETFFRIHKSVLVNLNHISEYKRGDGYSVILTNGKKLPVSHRKNESLVKRLTGKV
ncbi:MAG: DNA-binding response regulator [Chitinophagaceae bacterium]|nr:MAG: DNA-binding response regulator [Chitinophagaceae bacterium]